MRRLALFVVSVVALNSSPFVIAERSTPALQLADILRAWQKRSDNARTFRYQWRETKTEATASLPRDSIFAPVFVQPEKFDKEFVSHTIDHSLQFNAGALWWQRSGGEYDHDADRFLHETAWLYFANSQNVSVFITPEKPALIPEDAPAVAFISEGDYENRAVGTSTVPIILQHRPLDKTISLVTQDSLKLTSDRKTLFGHTCVQLTDGACSYWVDIENDFLIRRYQRRFEIAGVPESREDFRVDVEYSKDSHGQWVVAGWTLEDTVGTDGRPWLKSVAAVGVSDVNGQVEPNDKVSRIPVGARVNDWRKGSRATYILLDNDQRRDITKDDTKHGSPTYEELVKSKSGHAVPQDFIELRARLRPIRDVAPADQDTAITALKKYLSNHRLLLRDMDLVRNTANRLFESKDPESAIRMCRDLAGLSATLDRALTIFSLQLKGDLRRQRLVGSQMVVDGKTVEGMPFQWDSYRGKVVLVDFLFIGCHACVEAMPHIKQMFERYHDSGFDVVGISIDEDKEQLQAFLAKNQIPWTTIQDKTEIGNRARYNVESFPTKILVDRSGKVLWLDDAEGRPVDENMIKQALETK